MWLEWKDIRISKKQDGIVWKLNIAGGAKWKFQC